MSFAINNTRTTKKAYSIYRPAPLLVTSVTFKGHFNVVSITAYEIIAYLASAKLLVNRSS